jgi:hypothetical protein
VNDARFDAGSELSSFGGCICGRQIDQVVFDTIDTAGGTGNVNDPVTCTLE